MSDYVQFGEAVDVTPDIVSRANVDLTPYKNALASILIAPPMTKALPVMLTNERGYSAASVKKRFLEALAAINGSIENVDAAKVSLVFRNANPGTLPITKMYVKWQPKVAPVATPVPVETPTHRAKKEV